MGGLHQDLDRKGDDLLIFLKLVTSKAEKSFWEVKIMNTANSLN